MHHPLCCDLGVDGIQPYSGPVRPKTFLSSHLRVRSGSQDVLQLRLFTYLTLPSLEVKYAESEAQRDSGRLARRPRMDKLTLTTVKVSGIPVGHPDQIPDSF
jgi:hypothetical protein